MKKIFRNVLTGLLVTSFALTGVTTVSAKDTNKGNISQIVAFGDSLSDNGRANAISKAILALPEVPEGAYEKPGDLYWENRYSNSYSAVEVLAQKMDASLTNYAVGGAKSGYTNYSPWMDIIENTGMLAQVDKHIASLDGELDADALYFIAIGGNDIPTSIDDVNSAGDNVVANIEIGIRKLAENGAKKFLIPGSTESALVPVRANGGPEKVELGKQWSARINDALPGLFKSLEKELGIDIEYADIAKEMRKVANNQEKYNIKYMTKEAQPTWPEVLPGSPTPDEHFFFDEWHPTGAGHRILAEVMYKAAQKIK